MRILTFAVALALAGAPVAAAPASWPMPGHDPQRTSRATVASAPAPRVVPGWPRPGASAPLVTPSGARLVPSGTARTAVMRPDGTWIRTLGLGPVRAVGHDGRLYVQRTPGDPISAYAPSGALLWRASSLALGPEASTDVILPAPGGAVYAAGDGGVVALGADGSVRWRVPLTLDDDAEALAVAGGGTVYHGASATNGSGPVLVARDPGGTATWTAPLDGVARRIAVTAGGTVLVVEAPASATAGGALAAYSPAGTRRWTLRLGRDVAGLAVAADGTAYVVEARGVARPDGLVVPGTVRAVDTSDGTVRWTVAGRIAAADPVVGGDGTLYVGGTPLTALRPDGTRAWSFPATGRALVPQSIGPDGTLYARGGVDIAIAGPSLPSVAPPSTPRRGTLLAGPVVSPRRLRMTGAGSVCPVAGLCRPPAPLGATVRFVLARSALVTVTIRDAGGRIAARRSPWRAGAGITWEPIGAAAAAGPLRPGRYALTVRAAAGAVRVTSPAVRFTVVR